MSNRLLDKDESPTGNWNVFDNFERTMDGADSEQTAVDTETGEDTRQGRQQDDELAEDSVGGENIWQLSPYTYSNTDELYGGVKELSINSVYSIEIRHTTSDLPSGDASGNALNRVSPIEIDLTDHLARPTFPLRSLSPFRPPVGHYEDLKGWIPRNCGKSSSSHVDADRAGFFEEEMPTAFSDVTGLFGLKRESSLSTKKGRKEIRNSLKLADSLIHAPLSKVWHILTEVVLNLIFLLNVAVAACDIIQGPQYLYFKVTTLILSMLENVVAFLMWVVSRHPKFKNSEQRERLEKYQQYIENIVSELLIYPLFTVAILGFTTEKMYQSRDAFTYVQLSLLVGDIITLIYSQALRMHMIRRLMRDLKVILDKDGNEKSFWHTAGYILPRCYWTVISNFLLMLGLATMFGLQSNRDNYVTSNYRLTPASSLIMVLLFILPSGSLLLFFIVNMYWILEILAKISICIGTDPEFQTKMRKDYGDTLSDALHYSRSKVYTYEKQLSVMQDSTTVQKVVYCMGEVQFSIIIFAFQWLVLATIYFYDGFEDVSFNWIVKVVMLLLFVIANPQLALLMFLSNFLVLATLIGLVAYPLSLPFLCREKTARKYSQLDQGTKNKNNKR